LDALADFCHDYEIKDLALKTLNWQTNRHAKSRTPTSTLQGSIKLISINFSQKHGFA
jgi:hypothetical protein